ncbi:MAG TPA: 1,2-phenylacetyl-CoA epoxidase subunit PaaD [Caulobacteraceae bacterium]|nr:1,2-phenylacetyl-CoA epoxidase subunit PaaD [Caulobacteraceae bacterium]
MTRADRVRALLSEVLDPEIPVVSVIDLGIVRQISADGREVAITPTYSGCPATAAIETAVRAALSAAGLGQTRLTIRLDPPWTTDWITEEGRAKLHAYGIAPPSPAARPSCPRCGSSDTVEVSAFGSTPCKALWRCLTCAEPFDRFKCH